MATIRMPRHNGRWEMAFALLVSALLHLLVIAVVQRYGPQKAGQGVRVSFSAPQVQGRFFRPSVPMSQDQTQPAAPMSPELFGHLLAGEGAPVSEPGVGDSQGIAEPELLKGQFREGLREVAEKEGRQTAGDTAEKELLPGPLLHESIEDLPWALGLVELDAYGRERTTVRVDPETKKLKSAQLHLPAYLNEPDPGPCPPYQGGQEIVEVLDLVARGFGVPRSPPLASQIHWFELGPCGRLAERGQEGCCNGGDPIHTFPDHPARHILAYEEMREYPVLFLQFIDVESTEAAVRYLMEGGFAMVGTQQLSLLAQTLQARVGARLKPVTVELRHPLFHAFYDITAYVDPTPPPTNCPAIGPLPGLELDGRLIAIIGPRFNRRYPCRGNKLYVNALAYALIQPSAMGGRYLSHPN